jgi:hypothetical protein
MIFAPSSAIFVTRGPTRAFGLRKKLCFGFYYFKLNKCVADFTRTVAQRSILTKTSTNSGLLYLCKKYGLNQLAFGMQ